MAHTCPECGSYCTCNGDIDDIDWGEDLMCECCPDDGLYDDDFDDLDQPPDVDVPPISGE